ncbi:MAG: precorrin-3B C(17)-methyltransferase [Nitrospira bacterium HGW-Nitrospira-1]|nr:MAG: precorrin-3B C(17)-methyltransferase [Nitrospira bacterium HGW-Nitrospira-1]
MAAGNKAEQRAKSTIFYITDNGFNLAKKLQRLYPDAQIQKFNSRSVSKLWNKAQNLIFIMAAGIVVRTIALLIKDKKTDPAVVVLDEKGKFAVSLLSGHLGGGNELAKEIANFLKGEAVITTASDINSLPSIDLWAKKNGLVIENWNAVPAISTRLINNGRLNVYDDIGIVPPPEFIKVSVLESADIIITNKSTLSFPLVGNLSVSPAKKDAGQAGMTNSRNKNLKTTDRLLLRPQNLIIGIGCNRGTSEEEIEDAAKTVLKKNNLSFLSVFSIATIDIKAREAGLKAFAEKYGFTVNAFSPDELNSIFRNPQSAIQISEAAFKATGAYAVAEPAALLASGAETLLVPKQKSGNVTVAVVLKGSNKLQVASNKLKNKGSSLVTRHSSLYIVGTGPGSIEHITPYAQNAIKKSDAIVGYGTYLELIKELIKDKEIVSTAMTQEIDRCKKAVELAMSGKTVSVISSGDPGIYAMAGLVFEILKDRNALCVMGNELKADNTPRITHHASRITVEVIPGISALNACAARLGAPLMHDFAVISLSDRLTAWDTIQKRLEAAAMADFVTVLYNPKSMGRPEHINKARAIFLRHRSAETPVGIVKGAMRKHERIVITDLKNMLEHGIDMQTTVIIGNSQTFVWGNRMITPRGYEGKLLRRS